MKRTTFARIVLAAAATLFLGCARKTATAPPAPPPPAAPAAAEAPAVQPPPPAPAEDPQAKPQALLAEALKPIYFDYEKSVVKPAGKEILGRIGTLLKSDTGLSITVAGNTDERGSTEYNLALGERRAAAAFQWLREYGVRGSQLRTVSYGKEQPVATGHDEESWSKNRRDEFTSNPM